MWTGEVEQTEIKKQDGSEFQTELAGSGTENTALVDACHSVGDSVFVRTPACLH